MGACGGIAKCILLFVNVLFLLVGLLLLAVGIVLVVLPDKLLSFASKAGLDFSTFSELSGGFFMDIIHACGIAMIVLGAILSVIAFCGFFGSCCENKCLLGTYAVIMIAIILVEIAIIVFVAVYPNELNKYATEVTGKALKAGFKSDVVLEDGKFKNSSNVVDIAWMAVQFQMKCCGSGNYSDYNSFPWTRFKCTAAGPLCPIPPEMLAIKYVVPISCCKLQGENPHFPDSLSDFKNITSCLTTASPDSTNHDGCITNILDEATSFLKKYSTIVIGVAAGIVIVEAILVAFAMVLCCKKARK